MPRPRSRPITGPRKYLRFIEQFGHADPADWRTDIPAAERDHLRAAQVQHDFARAVLIQITRLDLTREEVAAHCDISAETLNGHLRGAKVLPLDRMHRIAAVVALRLTIDTQPTE